MRWHPALPPQAGISRTLAFTCSSLSICCLLVGCAICTAVLPSPTYPMTSFCQHITDGVCYDSKQMCCLYIIKSAFYSTYPGIRKGLVGTVGIVVTTEEPCSPQISVPPAEVFRYSGQSLLVEDPHCWGLPCADSSHIHPSF